MAQYQPLKLAPGINYAVTTYSREGYWWDCDKIRFVDGSPKKLGGWQPYTTNIPSGIVRSLFVWSSLSGLKYVGIGTSKKFYVELSGTVSDITPLRNSVTLANDPFSTDNGSSIVEVTHTAHGALAGDTVVFSGATAVGGLTPSGAYVIVEVTDANTYTIDAGSNASSTATGGGASVDADYEINIGPDALSTLSGFGAGSYGLGTWGGAAATGSTPARMWWQTSYGEDLVANIVNGPIYYWDSSAGTSTRMTALADDAGADEVPVSALVVLSGQERQVIAYGVNPIGSSTPDPMFIRWSSQEDLLEWTPTITNAAGGYRLSKGSRIIAAVSNNQQYVVFTDAALYIQQFVGGDFIYDFAPIEYQSPPLGVASSVTVQGVTYWMANGGFYAYQGGIRLLDCTVLDKVFDDISLNNKDSIVAGSNSLYNEVWWFYCSSGATYNDRYVVYNYVDNAWYFGSLSRTAWVDSPIVGLPLAAAPNTRILTHEIGCDDNTTGSPAPIEAFIESADFDIGSGDEYTFLSKVIPDLKFVGSTIPTPNVNVTLSVRNAPGDGDGSSYSQTAVATAVSPTALYSDKLYYRLRGRQVRVRVASSDIGSMWALGTMRIQLRPDGRQ